MIKVYTIENCPYCREIKEGLKNLGIKYKEVNVDLDENIDEFEEIVEVTEVSTVPMIRIKNEVLVPDVSFKTINEAVNIIKELI